LGIVLFFVGLLVIGMNESILFLWDCCVLMIFIYSTIKLKRIDWTLLIVGILCFFPSLLVLLSPGNSIRSSAYAQSNHVGKSLGLAAAHSVRHLFRFLSVPYVLVIAFFAKTIRDRGISRKWQSVAVQGRWLVVLLVLMFLFLIPGFWGLDGIAPRRNLNILCFVHYALMTPLLILCLLSNPKLETLRLKIFSWLERPIIFLFVFAISYFSFGHIREGIRDSLWNAQPHEAAYWERQNLVKKGGGQDLEVPEIGTDYSFVFDDISSDPNDGRNIVYSQYYGLKSVRAVPRAAK
jgi:Family of unknown function (DUF6056)